MVLEKDQSNQTTMTSKAAIGLVIIILCLLLFPVIIGTVGGVFGLVFGIIGGVFGAVFGVIGAVFGAIFGAIGEVIGFLFSWPFSCGVDNNFLAITALIIVAVLIARRKNLERRNRPTK